MPLAMGRNRISVSSTDAAGMEQRDAIVVTRKDGRPVIKISAPKQVARAELPKLIRIIVDVSDVEGVKLQDATVSYTLGGPGWTAQDFEDQTDANGRSVVGGGAGGRRVGQRSDHRHRGHRRQRRAQPGQPRHRDPLTRPVSHGSTDRPPVGRPARGRRWSRRAPSRRPSAAGRGRASRRAPRARSG